MNLSGLLAKVINFRRFLVVQGCPARTDIAPYIAMLANDAQVEIDALYRGSDATGILHHHGHRTQQELIDAGFPADPVDESSHCLRSDGRAYPAVPKRGFLEWWGLGMDFNVRRPGAQARIYAAARKHGWEVFQPYSTEPWHFNFRVRPRRPRPGTKDWFRFWRLRATLPTS